MRRLVVLVLLAGCATRAKHSLTLYESGDYAGAARAADEGLAQHPDDDGLWAMRVRAAIALGDADGAATTYTGYRSHRGDDDRELLHDLAVATLGQALASPSARLKIVAIDAVAELETAELADQVAERLGDDDDRVAASAAVAVLHGYPQAPQVASDMLRSENAQARRIAVDGIGHKVGKLAIADLEKAADDPDAGVRGAALRWLGSLADADAVEVSTRRLRDPDDAVRAAAASALAKIGLGNLEAFGKQALADHALAVRLAGIELVAAAHRSDLLAALVDDADPIVAVTAVLAAKRPELAAKPIARAVAADDWTVRAGAANLMVAAVGREAARPLAEKLAGDHDARVAVAAARVLAHLGDRDRARPVFASAAAAGDVQAAADLAELGEPDALSRLVRDRERSPEQRADAARAHRGARVTPGLVAALADPNGLVRVEAAAALGKLVK